MNLVKPKVIVLCGSSRFIDLIAVCAWLLERDEQAITLGMHLLPEWFAKREHHQAEFDGVDKIMDALHLKKIEIADEIFVVNFGDYIGESCANEIRYATARNVPVRYYTDDAISQKVILETNRHQMESEHA